MKVVYYLTLVCAILISCRNKATEKKDNAALIVASSSKEVSDSLLFDIDLEKCIHNVQQNQIPLSSFIGHIEYIPLETTSKSLIGGGTLGIQQYLVTDKVIVADMKIFSRKDGHYIGDLLKKGQGPEEYLYIMCLDADDEREEFYLYDSSQSRIHIVGYDNTYKGSIGGCGANAGVFSCKKGNILIPNYGSLSKRHDAFFIDNVDTKDVVYKHTSPALKGVSNLENCKRLGKRGAYVSIIGDIGNKFWKYKDEIRYYDTLTDTIYTINGEYKIKPLGYLNTEKIRMTTEEWHVGIMSRNFYVYNLMKAFETTDNIIFYFHKYNTVISDYIGYWIVFLKKIKVLKLLKSKNPILFLLF